MARSSSSASSSAANIQNSEKTTGLGGIILTKSLSKAKFEVLIGFSPLERKYFAVKLFPFKGAKPSVFYTNEVSFAKLRHENIVRFLDSGEQGTNTIINLGKGISYIIMELAPYGDLYDIITRKKIRIDERLARTFFHQIINGLEYLHSMGVAHLDLKLENLLLGPDYKLKICDFDQAYFKDHTSVLSKGTQNCRAPEIVEEECQIPQAADIYSAGIILFTLMSQGFFPYSEISKFKGEDMFMLMVTDPDLFWEKTCDIQKRDTLFFSEDFRKLFMSMVEFDPVKRLTVREVKESRWYAGEVFSHGELKRLLKNSV